MNELARALTANSAHAPPAHILDALPADLADHRTPGATHTVYQELWHITYWQQVTLDWIAGIETPAPIHNDQSFPDEVQIAQEPWEQLCQRFFTGNRQAGIAAEDQSRLDNPVRCPSPPGRAIRTMSIREQLESLAAHNAYHFGRIVLLRQMNQAWPPPAGGFTW